MNSRSTIQQELKELSSLLPHEIKQPVFTVPEGYFEAFAASVWEKLRGQHGQTPYDELTELSPVLAAIPKKMPFTVPQNYFSGFTQTVPELVKDDEVPQALQSISRQMPHAVPAGYFEGLSADVLAKVNRPGAKVVSFGFRRLMRVAAAAVVVGVMALTGWVLFGNEGGQPLDPNTESSEWVAKRLQGVSNQALEDFIMTADIGYEASADLQTGNGADVQKLLKEVSDSELDAFLKQVPTANEELYLIN